MTVRKKIAVIIGTRPEAVKLAPVIEALHSSKRLRAHVILTGQHRELLDGALESLNIHADETLQTMAPGQSLAQLTASLINGLGSALGQSDCAGALVQGDTTSAFSGALAAFYAGVPVGHVEAGLRTETIRSPFPEEANRRLIARLAHWHFAPTPKARKRLLQEGVDAQAVTVTGNTVIDALVKKKKAIDSNPSLTDERMRALIGSDWRKRRIVLATLHRRENHGRPLAQICEGLRSIALLADDISVILPVHANPSVKGPVTEALGGIANIHLVDPLAYDDLLRVLSAAHLAVTDSGGIQEEAPSFQTPVIVTRQETEREEAVDAGAALLAGHDAEKIFTAAHDLLTDDHRHRAMIVEENPFGDGAASARICKILEEALG
ncbi:MAG: UDP-N-acetylglucosamine 2-epimerase (non-hydrolyzing) [Pseudomonadota bacterium]